MSVYGLADCNNFFVSCERVFGPALEGRPAVVLSSNDGCVIARSDEAKALGVKMAQPAFQAKDLIEQHRIAVISGNLQFYTDMSNRVMQVFGELVPGSRAILDRRMLSRSHGNTGRPHCILPAAETYRAAMDRAAGEHRHRRDQDPCQDRQPSREDLRQDGRRPRSHRRALARQSAGVN